MFGKPEWFKKKTWGWALVPATRQGWVYSVLAALAVLLPGFVLLTSGRKPEALVWLLVSACAVYWDARQVARAMSHPAGERRDVLYIGDDEPDSIQTGQLDLRLRR
jgi:hypothetical protein